MVIWLCGLSGSGKTTIGKLVWEALREKYGFAAFLDGDELRAALGGHIGHDLESRRQNSIRIGRLCELLDRQGIPVVCCAVTIAPEVQLSNRTNLTGYFEVFIDVRLEVLEQRDPKGIYRRARAGLQNNVSGVDIPYVPPENPHLVFDNNLISNNHSKAAQLILVAAGEK